MSASLVVWRRTVSELYHHVRDGDDPEQGFQLWRAGRDRLFAEHPDSPLEPSAKAAFTGLPHAPYDAGYRFTALIEADVEPAHLEIPTESEQVVSMTRFGRVQLGDLGSLDVWWLGQYGGGLFLPLRDTTAGGTTYGGGRYVLDTAKGADLGSGGGLADGDDPWLVVDLNFAYHPSCAYSPRWVCPLAQAGNRLSVDVPVGEQYPADGWSHDSPAPST